MKLTRNWPYFQQDPESYRLFMEDYYYFMIDGYKGPFGYAHKILVEAIEWPEYWHLDHEKRVLTLTVQGGFSERTDAMQATLKQGHKRGKVDCLRKWGAEVLPVISANGDHVLDMDLCGVDVFGIRTFGVHLTAYVRTDEGLKYWVPRRAKTKTPYAGMLDNTVAANLFSGQKPLEKIIRRAADEASIPIEYTSKHTKACGTVTYQMTRTNEGKPGCQHHVQYVYEMELAPNMVPKPFNGDVEKFKLMTLQEVVDALHRREFNFRAMTWVAHFIRHGIVNPDNEPKIIEVCARLHRKHDLFVV
ncbi:thiamine pyrophosphokinase-related protein [Acephala macrosclerotiorum]|nr:thiamine pyrophosphokinase-related protein [Acephala macrosclerotiorum]